ncbi:MAG: complex I subunit 1/NuoH family protein [Thermoplasmatota archaeon]
MGKLTDFVDTTLANFWDAPLWLDVTIAAFIGGLIVFTTVLGIGGCFTFAFRRIFARMGNRSGPNRVGPQGIAQFLADGLKLIGKEDIKPARADALTWRAAAYVAVIPTVIAWSPLPWSEELIFTNVAYSMLVIFAFSAIAPLGEIMAGWGSNNKYALYGGVRAAALDVSYEIPMTFALASVVLMTGSTNTQDIVMSQEGLWNIVPQIIGFGIFFIAALAKAGLAPTDLAESESELVAGFTTEFSGMRFGMFFVVLFSNVFFISALMTMLYLGGWQALPGLGFIPGFLWFFAKSLFMCFIVFWVWSSLPRVRVDTYLGVAWKVMLPVSLFNFILTATLVKLEVL